MRKRITAVVLTVAILFSSCLVFQTSANAATSLQNQKNAKESELANLKKDKAAVAQSLAEAKSKANEQARVVELMYEEIGICQQEIDTTNDLINEYFALAQEKEKEIEEINARMDKNFELFYQRLEFAQISGNLSQIDFILGADDFSEILARTEIVKDILDNDRALIEKLESDRKEVEAAKAEIEVALQKCEEQKLILEDKITELNDKVAAADAYLAQLQADQNNQQAYYDAAAKKVAAKEKELDVINNQIKAQAAAQNQSSGNSGNSGSSSGGNSGGNYSSADWHGIWPVSNSYKNAISQYFKGSAHSGIDIHTYGVRNRVPALSVLSGTVVRTGMYASWGNLVVVQHDNGYQTYYAHLDTILVSNGQRVSQGQQVGLIGSTGNSTGAHLHMCVVTPSGVRVDPLPYIR